MSRSQSEVRNDTTKLLLDPTDTYPTRSLTIQSERSSEQIPSISWSVHPTSPLSSKSPTGTLSHENMDGNAGFFMVEVKLLSDEEVPLQMEVTNDCLGRVLFNQVIERLGGIIEKDYFGLRYLDRSKQRQWLEMSKTVYKQLKYVSPRSLNFRVKHYPSDPVNEFRQEKSRYLLYLQLRRDLHSGRLIGRNLEMHVLAACILQAEIGDYDVLLDYLGPEGTLADLKMFANITPKTESKIVEIYKSLKGMSMNDAENKFLENAAKFETYGIEPLYVQDRKGNHFYMGLNHEGVITYRGSRKAHVFSWQKINKISYEGKLFIIQVEWEQRRHTLGFKCPTPESAEALWKWAVDRQCFFTLNRSVDAKESKANGGLFKRRQFYTFTGRCQKELMQLNSSMPAIPQPSVSRSRSLLNLAKSVHDKRHSQSQNDLDRKYVDSNENLQDSSRMNRLIKGLDHHRSSLETRRNNNELDDLNDNLFMNKRSTDQLSGGIRQQLQSQTLKDQQFSQQQHQHKSSLSTPNLINIPGIHQNDMETNDDNIAEKKSSTIQGDLLTDKKKLINVTIEEKNEPKKSDIMDGEKQRTSTKTDQMNITNIMNLIQSNTDHNNDVNDSLSSGVEANAEATEQPLQVDINLNNIDGGGVSGFCTGSVNTLSSSPLKSVDEDDDDVDENNEFVNDALKQTNNSDTYQKIKVGNWLGANGIKSIRNTEDEPSPITSINQKTDNYNNNNNSETLNNVSNDRLNTKQFISIDSENIVKDDSYSPISTISPMNPYSNDHEETETKFIHTIKPSISYSTSQKIETNPIKSQRKQLNSMKGTIMNPINDNSSTVDLFDENAKQSSMHLSTINRSKSLYFNQNKSITTMTTTTTTATPPTTTRTTGLYSLPKSQSSSYNHIDSINTSKSTIYYPYACTITTIHNTTTTTTTTNNNSNTFSPSLYSSTNYHQLPLHNIKSMKQYTELPRKTTHIYPKLSHIDYTLTNQNDLLLSSSRNDLYNVQYQSRRQSSLGRTKSIKDLSPQPRDWHEINSNIINNNNININPDINNMILDPIETTLSKNKKINYIDYIDTKYNIINNNNNNEPKSISNDLLYNNGYYSYNNIKQLPSNKIFNQSNVTTLIHTNSSYYNISNSMMAQTSSCTTSTSSPSSYQNVSSLAEATKSLNLNKNLFSSNSSSEVILRTQPSTIQNQSLSNSLAYLTQSSNANPKPASNCLIDSSTYFNHQNNRKPTISKLDYNNNDNNRTAGSTAAYLAATGVGAYKLNDSLALLTTRTDYLIESNINNDTTNNTTTNNDNVKYKENPKSVTFNQNNLITIENNENNKKLESQTKTPSYYSIKQTSSYSPSIPPKPSYLQSNNNQSRIIYQSRENNNTTTTTNTTNTTTANNDDEEIIPSRTFSRSGEINSTIPTFEDHAIKSMKRVTDKVQKIMNLDQIDNVTNSIDSIKLLPPLANKSITNNQSNISILSNQLTDTTTNTTTTSNTNDRINNTTYNTTNNTESNTQFISCFQQFFYYFIVAFIVYKLIIWFNLKPTFG
ncbi:unnamed protein product [Schistosoma rodhaini]|nr:unnamed protein product [Schistosoma rodhaini]